MLNIQKNINLEKFNTLKIPALARFFCVVKSEAEFKEALDWARLNAKEIFILGGGSNILLSQDFSGLVIKNELKGIRLVGKKADAILVEAKSGEIWTKFVNFTVNENLYGLENLFLIYGTVGAAPVQNIGAYGVELKDCFHSLQAIDIKTGKEKTFFLKDCHFGYRDSIFKNKFKGRYFISSVTVQLKRHGKLQLGYGSIKEELDKQGIKKPTLKEVIAVISLIRNQKLPNPAVLPNVGSYFKNTEVSQTKFKTLQKKYPALPSFPAANNKVKIPTAWLIEQAGFRGKKIGPVSMYEKQALILVNHGEAQAKHVLSLVKKVKAAVRKKFGLEIHEEVNVI